MSFTSRIEKQLIRHMLVLCFIIFWYVLNLLVNNKLIFWFISKQKSTIETLFFFVRTLAVNMIWLHHYTKLVYKQKQIIRIFIIVKEKLYYKKSN